MTDMTDWDDEFSGENETEDDIIELTDIAEDKDGGDPEDDIIELEDIAAPEEEDAPMPEFELEMEAPLMEDSSPDDSFEEPDLSLEEPDDFLEEADVAEDLDDITAAPAVELPDSGEITSEQLETALERVIERQFSDKIETILFEVMEKVIEKELSSIRDSLQKDLDQIGNV